VSGQSIAIAVTITAALCVHLSIFFWWRTRWGQFRFRKQRAGSGSGAGAPRAIVGSDFSTHAPSPAAADEQFTPGEASRREMLRRLTAVSAQGDIGAKAPESLKDP
jgi:hypothetical protein